jgi:hypothetical protein
MVAFMWRRGLAIDPVFCQAGLGELRSIISADAVGAAAFGSGVGQLVFPPPPTTRILPASYIMADP